MRNHFISSLLAFALTALGSQSLRAEQPNILWITAEDMSPTLGCYGDEYATTPNIDDLASRSTRFTHAFATAPVCSPSRACLINGCIATTQGTHAMRSEFPIPSEMTGFPALLRERGYYTSNNEKTDYNSAAANRIIESSWDACGVDAHWRGRKDGQPFFSIFNLMTSHQSRTMVWPYEQFQTEIQSKLPLEKRHDPATAPVPPYYPDTPVVRKTIARFYDCVSVMDQEVGELLRQLREDGLEENTIVFFYADHGSGMPRHKRTLFDSGMHVPLLVHAPSSFQDICPTKPESTDDRLVCFEDFGPTVLSLAGLKKLPNHMRGKPFYGPHDSGSMSREYLFGHRDRVDEVIDMARSVRSQDFLYIRNYMPHLGWNQTSNWTDQGEIPEEFYVLARSGKASPAQEQFVGPDRPLESLFDCRTDPLNLNNLVDSPQHQATLQKMRLALNTHLSESNDLGFVPEIEMWRLSGQSPPMGSGITNDRFAKSRQDAAELVGSSDSSKIETLLAHEDASVRYWGAVGCSAASTLNESLTQTLKQKLNDESPAVQIEAAGALLRHGHKKESNAKLVELLSGDDLTVLLHAARTIELLGDSQNRQAIQSLLDRFQDDPRDMAWFIRFTATGYLSRLTAN